MSEFNYEKQTRAHYQNPEVAKQYKALYTNSGQGLRGYFAKKVSAGEKRTIDRALGEVGKVGVLLDLPCGTGKLAPIAARYAKKVVAADVSPAMIELAKPEYQAEKVEVEFVEADATQLTFPDRSFDVVVSLRLLHRVPHDVRKSMLKEFARVSRGSVIFSVGIIDAIQRVRLGIRKCLVASTPVPVSCSHAEIATLMEDAGLTIVSARPILMVLSAEWIFHAKTK